MHALHSGVSVKGATIYVYGLPVCPECTKSIIQAGIKRVVMSPDPYVYITPWTEKWDKVSKQMIVEVGDIGITYTNSDKLDWTVNG
jgi:dCMP deaminase